MTTTPVNRHHVNDDLAALAAEHGATLPHPVLDDLAHTIADALDTARGTPGHTARPDDDPAPGDRCKDCGQPLTWTGPTHLDWDHARGGAR